MGTTRIKVIDLSSGNKEIKTSRKHAEKLAGVAQLKKQDKKQEDVQKIEASPQPEEVKGQETEEAVAIQEPETPETTEKETKPSTKKAAGKKESHHHTGKNYKSAKKLVEDKLYTRDEALELLPKTSYVKFDPSVEIHLGVNDKNLKGNVTFPHLKVKKQEKTYLVFTDKKFETEKKVIFGDEKTIKEIESGTLKPQKDFEVVLTTPKFMPQLATVAKILGPKGMMPNPKAGTINPDPQKFLENDNSSEAASFRCDPLSPVIHTKIGKLSQKPDELKENLKALTLAVGHSKIKKATLTSTMGPAIKVDPTTLFA